MKSVVTAEDFARVTIRARVAPNIGPETIDKPPPERAWIAWIPGISGIKQFAPTRELAMERLMRRWGPKFRAGFAVQWAFESFLMDPTLEREADNEESSEAERDEA